MDTSKIGPMIVSLIGAIAVIDLVALMLEDAVILGKLKDKKWLKALFFGAIGGLFGIYATVAGYKMDTGAVVSIRDVGAMMAGFLGGPWAGLLAGVIAGLHRLLIGLPDVTLGTSIPCSISTLLIGIISGLLSKKFSTWKHKPLWALIIGALAEVLHLTIAFIYRSCLDGAKEAWDLISGLALPFIICNSIGFGLMIYVVEMIKKYKNTETHAKQVESELNIATSIQDSMLPKIFPDYPGRKEFSIFASMNPAKEVGGDFYDFFFVNHDHFAFLIADVSGKGVPAALFMVIAKTLIKNNLQSGLSPADAMTKTNKQLLEGDDEHMFVTCWVGVLELTTGKLDYVNCGHNPPIIYQNGQPLAFMKDLSGFVLAGSKKTKYKQYTTMLQRGDKLFLYTDGITEAMDKDRTQYGEKRLMDYLNKRVDSNISTEGIVGEVKSEVKAFTGEVEQSDDMTMLALKINGFYETETFEVKQENYDAVMEFMESRLQANKIPQPIISKMDIILDELYSNIVKYSGSQKLDFSVFVHDGLVSLKFVYGGNLFDITTTQEPDINSPLEKREAGGLGLFMVKKLSDKLVYESHNNLNCVTVDKIYS